MQFHYLETIEEIVILASYFVDEFLTFFLGVQVVAYEVM